MDAEKEERIGLNPRRNQNAAIHGGTWDGGGVRRGGDEEGIVDECDGGGGAGERGWESVRKSGGN